MRYLALTLLFWCHSLFADVKSCDLAADFDKNISHLIDWCEKHKIPEADCDAHIDSASELSEKEFKAKLYNLKNNSDSAQINSKTHSTSTQDWSQIPSKHSEAFQKLKELSSKEISGFTKKIEFGKHAEDYFASLKPAEIKHLFEIIEKMKTSSTKSELNNFLISKKREALVSGDSSRLACKGDNVFSVRLSVGARMCYQFVDGDSISIKILCIGLGDHCYQH